jgi:hypothetical protein
LALRDKLNIRTLFENIRFICTHCKTGQKSSPKQDRKAHQNRTEKLTKTGQKSSPKQDRKDHQNRTEKITKTGQKSSPKQDRKAHQSSFF